MCVVAQGKHFKLLCNLLNKQIMHNNSQAHTHTVYSYLQALLTVTICQHCAASYINSRYKAI
jgi:hypothetical protein